MPRSKRPPKTMSSKTKVRAHRERLRRQGLRPIQIWVPDVRSRGELWTVSGGPEYLGKPRPAVCLAASWAGASDG